MRDKWILFPVVVIGSITCFEPSDIPSEVQKGFMIFICDTSSLWAALREDRGFLVYRCTVCHIDLFSKLKEWRHERAFKPTWISGSLYECEQNSEKHNMRAKRRTEQSYPGVLKLKETNGLNSLFYEKERVLNYVTVLRLHWAATVATRSLSQWIEPESWISERIV